MQERDALLATKLRVPRSHDVLVRPRLLERLEEAASRELLLVSAPAGFGKSTLLAEWASGGGRPVAWVSLDADDNDPARLWRYLVAAVEQLHPGLEERALPLLHAPDQPALEALVTAAVNEPAAARRELTIVLDDYHVIESRPIHESLGLLLERLPPGVHVVIADAATRRFRWRGCAPGGSSPRCGRRTCASPRTRRSASCGRCGASTCPRRASWSGSRTTCGASCWTPRSLTGSAARCATRSPAAPRGSGCWRISSGPTCSWWPWTRSAAGTATPSGWPPKARWPRSAPGGDSFDNALAEAVNGLYKAELISRQGPWRTAAQVELATLSWVQWWNQRRLHGAIGDIPPAEHEAIHYRQQQESKEVA